MDRIIITTPNELKAVILEVLGDYLRPKPVAEKLSNTLSLEEAVSFLNESGYPISKGTIYQLTSKNQMPFGKFGNKLIFERKELLSWAQGQIIKVTDDSDALASLISSANKKMKR